VLSGSSLVCTLSMITHMSAIIPGFYVAFYLLPIVTISMLQRNFCPSRVHSNTSYLLRIEHQCDPSAANWNHLKVSPVIFIRICFPSNLELFLRDYSSPIQYILCIRIIIYSICCNLLLLKSIFLTFNTTIFSQAT